MATFKLSSKNLDYDEFYVAGRGLVIYTRREYVPGITNKDILDVDGKLYRIRFFEIATRGEFGLSDNIGILVGDME